MGGAGGRCYRRLNGSANFPPPEVALKPAWGPGQRCDAAVRERQRLRACFHGRSSPRLASPRLLGVSTGPDTVPAITILSLLPWGSKRPTRPTGSGRDNERIVDHERWWKRDISYSIQLQVASHETVRAQLLLPAVPGEKLDLGWFDVWKWGTLKVRKKRKVSISCQSFMGGGPHSPNT